MIYIDIAEEIEEKAEKLRRSINKNGIDSRETIKISLEIDNLIKKYFNLKKEYNEKNTMIKSYKKTLEEIKRINKKQGEFIDKKTWDEYAYKNNYLSHVYIEYITGLNWKELEEKMKSS